MSDPRLAGWEALGAAQETTGNILAGGPKRGCLRNKFVSLALENTMVLQRKSQVEVFLF